MNDAIIPIFVTGIIFMLPIIAILTKHQQRMAEIYREQQRLPIPMPQQSVELEQMRQMMAQQMIAIDNLAQSQRELAQSLRTLQSTTNADLYQRVGDGNG
jgi:hypothetical protein